ncbi:MAG TPA: response regulator transcription factor [Candidatus Acidoferrum sp.]|jgi:DNA-binding NarL/FixJ family response regulator|nr:response regulator transcription factor [Candidatus Acidoferrum sp.]
MSESPASVLIVDDNALIRRALRDFLERTTRMHVSGEASDGLEAIMQAKALNPDLILMDVSMPRMNGIEAASVIRKKKPDVCIVVFTLYPHVVGFSLARATGVDLVVSKTDGAAGLTEALTSFFSTSFPEVCRDQAQGAGAGSAA